MSQKTGAPAAQEGGGLSIRGAPRFELLDFRRVKRSSQKPLRILLIHPEDTATVAQVHAHTKHGDPKKSWAVLGVRPNNCCQLYPPVVPSAPAQLHGLQQDMSATGGPGPIISLEEGWKAIHEGIQKLEGLLSSEFDRSLQPFSNAEYMNIYT